MQVINGGPSGEGAGAAGAVRAEGRRRGASSPARAAPEKRRWAAQPYLDADELAARAPSSDDDDTKVPASALLILHKSLLNNAVNAISHAECLIFLSHCPSASLHLDLKLLYNI